MHCIITHSSHKGFKILYLIENFQQGKAFLLIICFFFFFKICPFNIHINILNVIILAPRVFIDDVEINFFIYIFWAYTWIVETTQYYHTWENSSLLIDILFFKSSVYICSWRCCEIHINRPSQWIELFSKTLICSLLCITLNEIRANSLLSPIFLFRCS